MLINHIGIIVTDLHRSVRVYSKLGYVLHNDIIQDNIQDIYEETNIEHVSIPRKC